MNKYEPLGKITKDPFDRNVSEHNIIINGKKRTWVEPSQLYELREDTRRLITLFESKGDVGDLIKHMKEKYRL